MSNIIIYSRNGFKLSILGQSFVNHDTNENLYLETDSVIRQISPGFNHFLILKNNGDLTFHKENETVLLMSDIDVRQICCRYEYSIILKNNGDLFIYKHSCDLFIEDAFCPISDLLIEFTECSSLYHFCIDTDTKITSVACGVEHILFLSENGNLFVSGSNVSGQLGLGQNVISQKIPVLLINNILIKEICCGNYHSMIYKKNGDIFVFGQNGFGQLGLGHTNNQYNPVLLKNIQNAKIYSAYVTSIILENNGDVYIFGSGYNMINDRSIECYYKPKLLLNDPEIKHMYCGIGYLIMLRNNGDLILLGMIVNLKRNNNDIYTTIIKYEPYPIQITNNVKLISNVIIPCEWSHIIHHKYSKLIQNNIFCFMMCLKTKLHGMKIPKCIVFEIIKNSLYVN